MCMRQLRTALRFIRLPAKEVYACQVSIMKCRWLEAQIEALDYVEGIIVLDDICGFFSKEEYEERKDSFPKTNFNVNLCKNFAPDSYYLYFFEFNGKKSMMKFEPDQMFADYLNDKISAAWEKAENEDDEDY